MYYYPPYDYQAYLQNQIAQQNQQIQSLQNQNQGTVIDFVQGETSVDVYPVNAGQKAILIDVDNPYVYHKERDINNVLTKHRYRLELDDEVAEEIDLTGYVKADQIAEIVSDAIEKKMAEYTFKPRKEEVKHESDNRK